MDQTNHWKFFDNTDISDHTVIIPSVAVGNVGQLSCDLLISSLHMKKIASIYSPAFIPVLGYDPYDLRSNDLSSCCELYQCASKRILVLQIRAPLVFKYGRVFLKNVVDKLRERKIKDLIILTSSFAHEKKHILTSPYRYLVNEFCPHIERISKINWVEHESHNNGVKILGGGFASLLYDICNENSLPCLVLYKYCSEGDNIPDAYEMIQYLSNVLTIFNKNTDILSQFIQPVSWKLLFGRPPPKDIY